MNEQRFVFVKQDGYYAIKDSIRNVNLINGCSFLDEVRTTANLLNEQHNELHNIRTKNATLHIDILELEKNIDEQKKTIKRLQDKIRELEDELGCQRVVRRSLEQFITTKKQPSTDIMSLDEYKKKYRYKRSDEVIAYELYLIIKKLDSMNGE